MGEGQGPHLHVPSKERKKENIQTREGWEDVPSVRCLSLDVWHQLKACVRPRLRSHGFCTVFGFCYLFVWGYGLPVSDLQDMRFWPVASSDT